MSALRALIAAMPDICRALDQIDPRWHDMAFARMADAAERDTQTSGGYSHNLTGYDPASTTLMPTARDGYDPLSAR